MKDYAKVHSSFWSSTSIRSLSEDGRMLALYLLTCQHGTIAGVFRLPDGYVAEDLQWQLERVSEVFAELVSKGFANRCETTKWVWITQHFRWNPPENPNQKKSAAKVAGMIPADCIWKADFMRDCAQFLGIDSPPPAEPFTNPSETLSEPVVVTVVVRESPLSPPLPGGDPPSPPKRERKRRGSETPISPDMQPDDANTTLAAENQLNLQHEFAKFKAHAEAKDVRHVNWQAALRNWLLKSSEMRAERSPAPSPQRSETHWYGHN